MKCSLAAGFEFEGQDLLQVFYILQEIAMKQNLVLLSASLTRDALNHTLTHLPQGYFSFMLCSSCLIKCNSLDTNFE